MHRLAKTASRKRSVKRFALLGFKILLAGFVISSVNCFAFRSVCTTRAHNSIRTLSAPWNATQDFDGAATGISEAMRRGFVISESELEPAFSRPWEKMDVSMWDDLRRLIPDSSDFLPGMKSPCWREEEKSWTNIQCLPAFILSAFPKSGSSDIHARIAEHPHARPSANKEPQFWNRFFFRVENSSEYFLRAVEGQSESAATELQAYLSQWQNMTREYLSAQLGPNRTDTDFTQLMTYESSPSLSWDFNTSSPLPLVLSELLPNLRMIMLMRSPVDRAWSDFFYFKTYRRNRTADSFHEVHEEAIAAFDQCVHVEKLHPCECGLQDRFRLGIRDGIKWRRIRNGGLHLGVNMYVCAAREWLRWYPRHRILPLFIETFGKDPRAFMTQIFEHLGLSTDSNVMTPEVWERVLVKTRKNKRSDNERKAVMRNDTRAMLSNFFEPFQLHLRKVFPTLVLPPSPGVPGNA